MKWHSLLSLSAIASLGVALLPGSALAQDKTLKEQLVGTWTIVSVDSLAADGTKRQLYGPNPKGIFTLSATGHFSQIITNPDRPKWNVNNRLEGTPEENKVAVEGTSAQFGTWSVDEASKTLTRHVEGSMFPNAIGSDSKTSIVLAGDKMKMSNPTANSGGRN